LLRTEFNIQVKNLHQMCRIESEVRGTLLSFKKMQVHCRAYYNESTCNSWQLCWKKT